VRFSLLALIVFSGCPTPQQQTEPLKCNGHEELCARRFDEVAFAGTHNSYSNTDEGFGAPGQTHSVSRQLHDGIRVLHFEVMSWDDVSTDAGAIISVCHGLCEIGQREFASEMRDVAKFLDANQNEVVVLLLERADHTVTADDLGNAIVDAGLSSRVRIQADGESWPTLGVLLDGGTPVIALLDDTSGSSYAWLLPRWEWTYETPWNNLTPADFARCGADRGQEGNSLYVVDTYLEDEIIPTAKHAQLINYDPFFIDRIWTCRESQQRIPNFVMINFYEVGDVFHAVDVLNGFAAPPTSLEGFPPTQFHDGGALDP
jgi:hypothetical protein